MKLARILVAILGIVGSLVPVTLSAETKSLESGFRQPPLEARPWVYWFWLNGNITTAGITADLEAMKRVGIGGVLIMEVDQGAPVGPADFMGTQWRDLFRHVHAEAQRLGLEVNMNNDAGWNGSGGPWIKPEQSMQEVVWTETDLTGPKKFEGTLAQPSAVAGYYRDIAVLAFKKVGDYRIPNIESKGAFQKRGIHKSSKGDLTPQMIIPKDGVVNLSEKMDAAGRLVWEAPVGEWTVIRFGHTCTGVENAPGAEDRQRARMRQAEPRRDRSEFQRHDGQAGGRYGIGTGQDPVRSCGHAHRQLGERLAELDRENARRISTAPGV